ncbi:VapC toxin family PIN domain ribonuclease [Asticcacaulis solisilvae]|uniref:VapC toxin family PIN domain ribonuclease n=1 Tax=Asticcacaulis solisilvae TaxID=1217274 RepID=UPI003FD80CBA
MFLLDTPVIAELSKAKSGRADEHVTRWASGVARHHLFVSVMSMIELDAAIAELEKSDPARGAAARTWLEEAVPHAFEGRILSVDMEVVQRRAALPHDGKSDRNAVLAATALANGLTLATRTPSAYRFSRIKLFNPWGYTPEDAEDMGEDWQQVARSGPMWLKNLFLRF